MCQGTVMDAMGCHEKFGPGPKPVRGDHFWLPKIVRPDRKCVRYWSVCTKSGPGGISVKRTAKMVYWMPWTHSAGDLMEEVYQYMMQKRYMYHLGCTEGEREA